MGGVSLLLCGAVRVVSRIRWSFRIARSASLSIVNDGIGVFQQIVAKPHIIGI